MTAPTGVPGHGSGDGDPHRGRAVWNPAGVGGCPSREGGWAGEVLGGDGRVGGSGRGRKREGEEALTAKRWGGVGSPSWGGRRLCGHCQPHG